MHRWTGARGADGVRGEGWDGVKLEDRKEHWARERPPDPRDESKGEMIHTNPVFKKGCTLWRKINVFEVKWISPRAQP
jgi:hypothetical protein